MMDVGKICFSLFISVIIFNIGFSQGVMKIGDGADVSADTNLLINAQVLENAKPKSGIKVIVEHNSVPIKESITGKDGFFELVIGFDTLVQLKFADDEYITKIIEIDTRNMPDEDRGRGYDAGLFKLSMVKKTPETPLDLYKKPIARFVYDPIALNFVIDRQYKRKVKESFKKADEKPDVIKF